MSNAELRTIVDSVISQVASESGKELVSDFGEETVLLECGLDSLDFAVVVARLERDLGFDPFSQLDEPVYPRTYADLIGIYEGSYGKSS